MKIHSFIDGAFYQTPIQFIKYNPYTLEKLHEVVSCDLMGLVMAIQSSNRGFQSWKVSSLSERIGLIEKIRVVLSEKKEEYSALEAIDQALPRSFTLKNSLELSLKNIDENKTQKPQDNFQGARLQYSPVGVIVIVASWNLSLRIILDRLIPALFAGNSVIVKISSASVVTAHILAEVLILAAIPKGLVNIIVTDDREVKEALLSHPGIGGISFTGAIETVTDILPLINKASLQNFKKIQISAGSKNSAVELTEPSDESFLQIMHSFLLGQGQLVWNSARLFVLEKFAPQWEEKIKVYLESLRPAEGSEDDSVWTPCIKKKSFARFGEIKNLAHQDKAKLLGGDFALSAKQKEIFLPAIFTKDMSRCSTLQQDQIHSPFYILSTVKYPFDVPKYSNISYFGFAAHLWGNEEKLNKLAEGLDVGLITYNKSSIEVPGAASTVKQSGFGLQDFKSFGAFFSNVKKLT